MAVNSAFHTNNSAAIKTEKNLYRDKIKYNICSERGVILWKLDNRKSNNLSESEFKKEARKILIKKAFSEIYTPLWNKNTKLIRKLLKEEK